MATCSSRNRLPSVPTTMARSQDKEIRRRASCFAWKAHAGKLTLKHHALSALMCYAERASFRRLRLLRSPRRFASSFPALRHPTLECKTNRSGSSSAYSIRHCAPRFGNTTRRCVSLHSVGPCPRALRRLASPTPANCGAPLSTSEAQDNSTRARYPCIVFIGNPNP